MADRLLLDRDFYARFDAMLEDAINDGVCAAIDYVSGFRSIKEQRHLFAQFRAGRRRLPVAKPGASYHNYGLAVDVAVSPKHCLARLGAYAEDYGFRWGGHFGDPVHFDAGDSLSLAQAKRRFNKRNLVEVT